MARAQYIWLVWRTADFDLAGAFTVKHEMESAIRRANKPEDYYQTERIRDGGSWGAEELT